MNQASLFDIDAAKKPVFGRAAYWRCFGPGVDKMERLEDNAHVCFIYLSECFDTAQGRKTRIRCPFIGFDRTGDFMEVYGVFHQLAYEKALEITGLEFSTKECSITTAWQGETRAIIQNCKASRRAA